MRLTGGRPQVLVVTSLPGMIHALAEEKEWQLLEPHDAALGRITDFDAHAVFGECARVPQPPLLHPDVDMLTRDVSRVCTLVKRALSHIMVAQHPTTFRHGPHLIRVLDVREAPAFRDYLRVRVDLQCPPYRVCVSPTGPLLASVDSRVVTEAPRALCDVYVVPDDAALEGPSHAVLLRVSEFQRAFATHPLLGHTPIHNSSPGRRVALGHAGEVHHLERGGQ